MRRKLKRSWDVLKREPFQLKTYIRFRKLRIGASLEGIRNPLVWKGCPKGKGEGRNGFKGRDWLIGLKLTTWWNWAVPFGSWTKEGI